MGGLVIDRALALRFRALAESGSEWEVRQELRRLAADFAGLIIAAEVRDLTLEERVSVTAGRSARSWLRWLGWLSRRPSYAVGA